MLVGLLNWLNLFLKMKYISLQNEHGETGMGSGEIYQSNKQSDNKPY